MATYRFVPGIDYGPRRGTLGWGIHMAEGGDGTLGWLSQRSGESASQWRTRIRGVSSTFVVLQTGEAVQMVPWGNASGNLNPNDRSTDKAFYGKRFLLEVLGAHFTDPNAYTLSAEICGFRRDGPNQAQVDTLVKLVAESRERYPDMVGAFGHADQTDTKGCPGTAPTMRQFWDRVGHGKFTGDDMPGLKVTAQGAVTSGVLRTTVDTDAIALHDRSRDLLPAGAVRRALGVYLRDLDNAPGYVITEADVPSWASASAGTFTPDGAVPAPPADCSDAIAVAVAADRAKAKIVYG